MSPVRKRRPRVHRNALTLERWLALSIGKEGREPIETLEAVFHEHRAYLGDDSFAGDLFLRGIDRRERITLSTKTTTCEYLGSD
jgi:hypothetical protein